MFKNLLFALATFFITSSVFAYDSVVLTQSLDGTNFQFNKTIRLSD